jgi:hypothetical protein
VREFAGELYIAHPPTDDPKEGKALGETSGALGGHLDHAKELVLALLGVDGLILIDGELGGSGGRAVDLEDTKFGGALILTDNVESLFGR